MTSPIGLASRNAAKRYARFQPGRERAVHDRPPQQHAGDEVERMLEMEQRMRVPQRRVVDPRQMPDAVVDDPEEERRHRSAHPRRDAPRAPAGSEHRQQRRPLGEDDVLDQVHREQVVHRDRLDRRDRPRRARAGIAAPKQATRHGAAGTRLSDQTYADRQGREHDERFRVPRPRVRIHGGTLRHSRGCSSMVEP